MKLAYHSHFPHFCSEMSRPIKNIDFKISNDLFQLSFPEQKLWCIVELSGFPHPRLSWLKNGECLAPSASTLGPLKIYSDTDRNIYTLEIVNSQPSDTGRYSAIARNPHGVAKASVRVEVNAVEDGPDLPGPENKKSHVDKQAVSKDVLARSETMEIKDSLCESVESLVVSVLQQDVTDEDNFVLTVLADVQLSKEEEIVIRTLDKKLEQENRAETDVNLTEEQRGTGIKIAADVMLTEKKIHPETVIVREVTKDEEAEYGTKLKEDITVTEEEFVPKKKIRGDVTVAEEKVVPETVIVTEVTTDEEAEYGTKLKGDITVHGEEFVPKKKIRGDVTVAEEKVVPETAIVTEVTTDEEAEYGTKLKGDITVTEEEAEKEFVPKKKIRDVTVAEEKVVPETIIVTEVTTDEEAEYGTKLKGDITVTEEEAEKEFVPKKKIRVDATVAEEKVVPETVIVTEM